MIDDRNSRIPNTSTAWQLWQQDMFDRDSPASQQAAGTNIVQGLYELWYYTLTEGLLDNGNASFSRFHLNWGNTPTSRVDVFVDPFGNPGLRKLRHWSRFMSAAQTKDDLPTGERQSNAIVLRLAHLHYERLQKSPRWNAAAIDWSAEAREVLAHVESIQDPEEL